MMALYDRRWDTWCRRRGRTEGRRVCSEPWHTPGAFSPQKTGGKQEWDCVLCQVQSWSSKEACNLTPGSWEYNTLFGKRDFVDV